MNFLFVKLGELNLFNNFFLLILLNYKIFSKFKISYEYLIH